MAEISGEYGSKIVVEEESEFGDPTRAVVYILRGGSYEKAKLNQKSVEKLRKALKETVE